MKTSKEVKSLVKYTKDVAAQEQRLSDVREDLKSAELSLQFTWDDGDTMDIGLDSDGDIEFTIEADGHEITLSAEDACDMRDFLNHNFPA